MAVDGSYTRDYYGLFYCNSMGLFEKYDAQSLLGHHFPLTMPTLGEYPIFRFQSSPREPLKMA